MSVGDPLSRASRLARSACGASWAAVGVPGPDGPTLRGVDGPPPGIPLLERALRAVAAELTDGMLIVPLHPRGGGPPGVLVVGGPWRPDPAGPDAASPTAGGPADPAGALAAAQDAAYLAEQALRAEADRDTEQARRAAEQPARAVVEALPEALVVLELGAGPVTVVRGNGAAAALFGRDPVGAEFAAMVSPGPATASRLQELAWRERTAWQGERDLVGDGRRVAVEVFTAPPEAPARAGHPRWAVARITPTDAAGGRRADRDAALDALEAAVLLTTAGGEVTDANPAAGRLLATPVAALLGRDVAGLLWPAGGSPLAAVAGDGRTRRDAAVRLGHTGAPPVTAAVTVAALRSGDTVRGLIVTCQDVDAREEAARAAQEFASVAGQVLRGPAEPERLAALAALADQVVDLGWLSLPAAAPVRRPVAVEELLADLAATAGPLTVELDAPGAEVWSDPARLRALLAGLLAHAARAAAPATVVTLACRREAGRVVLSVVDRGPGVAAGRGGRAFDAAEALDTAAAALAGDPAAADDPLRDLTLTTARRAAAALGAQLELDGRPGAGSAFRVIMPLRRDAGPGVRPAATGEPERRS